MVYSPTSTVNHQPNPKLEQLLDALEKCKARVTGSWARGEETEASDYDFYVPYAQWKRFLELAPPGWESCIVGHVAWRFGGMHGDLVEASALFKNQRHERLPERHVLGRTWRTW